MKERQTRRIPYETDLPTEHHQPQEDPWVPEEDEHQGGTEGPEEAPPKGEETPHRMKCRKGLDKKERIHLQRDFHRIYRNGRRLQTPSFTVITKENDLGFSRVAAVAGKRVGKAVARNRVKRLIREFFRLNKCRLRPSTDYLIIGKEGADRLRYQDVERELSFLLQEDSRA